MKTFFLVLLAFIFASIIAVFAFQDPQITSITVFNHSFERSKGQIFIACTLVGMIITLLWAIPTWIGQKFRIAALRRKISQLNKELGKREKDIDSKDAQINMKDDALDELSEQLTRQEKMDVIKEAFLPKK